jgi:hypothetical protein
MVTFAVAVFPELPAKCDTALKPNLQGPFAAYLRLAPFRIYIYTFSLVVALQAPKIDRVRFTWLIFDSLLGRFS